MSWLNNLAAKTENLLNIVDQAAGQALQREINEKQQNSWDEEFSTVTKYYSPYLNSSNDNLMSNVSAPQPSTTLTHSSSVGQNLSKVADPDTELINFLNSTNISTNPVVSHHKSGSLGSSKKEYGDEEHKDETSLKDSVSSNKNKDSMNTENQLLKNEINSLSRELHSIIGRLKATQDELSDARKKLNSQSRHLSTTEQMLRECQSLENDLRATVSAKDTQLGILRVRLEEAGGEVEAKKKRITEVLAERDSILLDHSQSTGVHDYALESLQDKLRELESSQQSKLKENQIIQEEFRNRVDKLESEKIKLEAEMNNLQKANAREKANSADLQHQLKTSKAHVESIRTEFATYKDKAGRILQSKEKLIASLRESDPALSSGGSTMQQSSHELESLVQERDMLREELINTQSALESTKNEILDLETQSHLENESLREQNNQLEEQLAVERQKLDDCEQDILKNKQELRYLHEDLLRQKNSFQTRVEDRENEIQRLRNQLTAKSMSTANTEELESRLHALTESLIQKQTSLEALSTEKNSLLLQLERAERQHREMEMSSNNRTNSTNLSMNDEEVRQRVPDFMTESPFDSRVTRRVKLAAGVIDKFSIRLGVFLRRYPIARMFIIIYVFLLHLWVMIVLLTYQPEIHANGHML